MTTDIEQLKAMVKLAKDKKADMNQRALRADSSDDAMHCLLISESLAAAEFHLQKALILAIRNQSG